MGKNVAAHICLDANAKQMTPIQNDIIKQALYDIQRKQGSAQNKDHFDLCVRDVVVYHVLGDKREEEIRRGDYKGADHINGEKQLKGLVICNKSLQSFNSNTFFDNNYKYYIIF